MSSIAPNATRADIVVIGLGPGGEEVAGRLAEAGLDVVGIEAELVGGECPYWGCVPSKMMIRAANLVTEGRRIPGMAGSSTVDADFAPVAARIRAEATDDWNDQVAVDRFVGKGGRFLRGRGRLTGPGEVQVAVAGSDDPITIHTDRGIVVATGTRPSIPSIPGLTEVRYWTNREAISTTSPPATLLVIGGGAIGVELAQAFARFGTSVTIVEAGSRLLALEEPEVGTALASVLTDEGICVLTAATIDSVTHSAGGFVTTVDGIEHRSAKVLVATGRHADLGALGLDTVGLDPSTDWLEVDDRMKVADGLWAVGDVTGKGAFTHMAMYQAGVGVPAILGQDAPGATYEAVPRVTFTDPEIGAVGLTEQAARDAGLRVRIGTAQVPSTARGWIHKAGNAGLIKIVEDADRGVLVGATSVGPVGGEVLGTLALAVHAQLPTSTLRTMIYAYPTFHRGIQDAVSALE